MLMLLRYLNELIKMESQHTLSTELQGLCKTQNEPLDSRTIGKTSGLSNKREHLRTSLQKVTASTATERRQGKRRERWAHRVMQRALITYTEWSMGAAEKSFPEQTQACLSYYCDLRSINSGSLNSCGSHTGQGMWSEHWH